MCPPVLSNLVQKRSYSYTFRYSNMLQLPAHLVRVYSSTRHQCYWTHFQMILENVHFYKCNGLILSWNGKNCNFMACYSKWASMLQVHLYVLFCIWIFAFAFILLMFHNCCWFWLFYMPCINSVFIIYTIITFFTCPVLLGTLKLIIIDNPYIFSVHEMHVPPVVILATPISVGQPTCRFRAHII